MMNSTNEFTLWSGEGVLGLPHDDEVGATLEFFEEGVKARGCAWNVCVAQCLALGFFLFLQVGTRDPVDSAFPALCQL